MESKILFVILTIINCFFGALAAYILKKSSHKINNLFPIKKGIKEIWKSGVLIGIIIYGLTAIVSIFILRILDVTLFFPLTSFTYIFSFILASKYLDEKITLYKVMGIILIITGIILIF